MSVKKDSLEEISDEEILKKIEEIIEEDSKDNKDKKIKDNKDKKIEDNKDKKIEDNKEVEESKKNKDNNENKRNKKIEDSREKKVTRENKIEENNITRESKIEKNKSVKENKKNEKRNNLKEDDMENISYEEILKMAKEIIEEDNTDKEKNLENIEEKTEENIEEKTEENVEEKTEENIEENTEENVEEKTEENIEENTEENIEENTEENVEENTEENVEENTEEDNYIKEDDSLEIIKNRETEDICNMVQKKVPNINSKDLEIIKKLIEKENKKNIYIANIKNKIKKIKNINKKFIYKILMGITILMAGVFSYEILIMKYRANSDIDKNIYKSKSTINLNQPESAPNNSRYIYISKEKKIGKDTFNLLKILIDGNKTIFYFNENIDWNKYKVILEDNKNKIYNRHLNNKSYLEFDNLEEGVKGIILNIEKRDTKEKIDFVFFIKKGVVLPKNLYLNESINVLQKNETDFKINKSIFSSSDSLIYYTIKESENSNIFFEKANILQNNMCMPLKENEYFKKENILLGRLNFCSLYDLKENIKIQFSDVYEINKMNKEIEINKLFNNSEESQIEIKINNKTIILERLGLINNRYILVLHGLDENNNRIKLQLDAFIKCKNIQEEEIILKGISKSKDIGTDMIFNLEENKIDNKHPLILDIKAIKFKVEDIIKDIDLNYCEKGEKNLDILEEAKNILKENKFINIENITYNIENDIFLGIFVAQKKDYIYKYLIEGKKYENNWNFKRELISKENII